MFFLVNNENIVIEKKLEYRIQIFLMNLQIFCVVSWW